MLVPDRCNAIDVPHPVAFEAPKDGLTQLPLRAAFLLRIERDIAQAKREEAPLTLLLVDLRGVSAVLAQQGRFAADHVLALMAHRLRCTLRQDDYIARLEPEVYAALLPGPSGRAGWGLVVERARAALHQPVKVGQSFLQMRVGLGLASCPRDGTSGDALCASALRAAAVSRPG